MKNLMRNLKLGGSTVALLAAWPVTDTPAMAQNAAPLPIEEVVVTGTNIRGVAAPIGSSLITVGMDQIDKTSAQTMEQVLTSIPALTNFGALPQGQLSGSTAYQPNIHQLGSSASNSTLTVIDGHTIPFASGNHDQVDPNIIPTSILERVEVLADGASSIYGSNAVAGVVNMITRKSYEGVQINLQAGFGSGYRTATGSLLWGTSWTGGNVVVAFSDSSRGGITNYSHRTSIFELPDKRPAAIANGLPASINLVSYSFTCEGQPATLQPNGTGNLYLPPDWTTNVPNVATNATCNSTKGYLTNPEQRINMMTKVSQGFFGGRVVVTSELLLSNLQSHSLGDAAAAPTVTATVFGAGPQANPFYINPPGVTATKQTVRFSFDGLLKSPTSMTGQDVYWINTHAEWNIDDNWRLNLGIFASDAKLYGSTTGYTSCASCILFGLNGTNNSTGSTTAVSITGTNAIVTTLPLTTSNAIDVWHAPASNKTSAAVLQGIMSTTSISTTDRPMTNLTLQADGSLFDLPAGTVKVAVGASYLRYAEINKDATAIPGGGIGPSITGSSASQYRFGRSVAAAYAELIVPIVDPKLDIPLVSKFDLDISGRYDKYSDVGVTKNPKVAFNWTVIPGIEFRGNASTSFVAPALNSIGDPGQGYNYNGSSVTILSSAFNVNTLFYPQMYTLPTVSGNGPTTTGTASPCASPAPVCTVPASVSNNYNGLRFIKGGGLLKPQTGRGWSIGAHLTPETFAPFLEGVILDVTLFENSLKGGITSPNLSAAGNVSQAQGLLYLFPNGATIPQYNALIAGNYGNNLSVVSGTNPVVGTPGFGQPNTALVNGQPIYYINNFNQQNVLNLWIRGFDTSFNYQYQTDGFGSFSVGNSSTIFTEFKESYGLSSPYVFSILNTNGFNQTFPSIQLVSSSTFGWDYEGFGTQFTVQYTGGYRNWGSNSLTPLTVSALGVPTGGGDKVAPNVTVNLHLAYSFTNALLGGDEVFVDVVNLLNSQPPFYATSGYDGYAGNPIGRVSSVGFRAKF